MCVCGQQLYFCFCSVYVLCLLCFCHFSVNPALDTHARMHARTHFNTKTCPKHENLVQYSSLNYGLSTERHLEVSAKHLFALRPFCGINCLCSRFALSAWHPVCRPNHPTQQTELLTIFFSPSNPLWLLERLHFRSFNSIKYPPLQNLL